MIWLAAWLALLETRPVVFEAGPDDRLIEI